MSLLVKGGRLVDPASGTDEIMDIFIEGEKILKIGKNINLPAKKIIDATGSVVIPGLIDMHTHLRDPGREDEETIRSGTLAAARGGFTTICCMPNTSPVIDDPSLVHYILRRAEKEVVIEVLPIASITKNEEGKVLSEMGRLRRAGAVSFSDDGKWVRDAHLMRRALEYVKMLDLPLISHCEDDDLSKDGVINEGFFSTILGLPGIPREAEEIAVFRDICLTRLARSSLHIAHISTVNSLNLVREAKKRVGKNICLFGNLDPINILEKSTPKIIENEVKKCMYAAAEGGGYIFSTADQITQITPFGNVEAMIRAVKKLYQMPDSEYRKMRENCRKHIEKNFTIEKMTDRYEEIFRKILEKKDNK